MVVGAPEQFIRGRTSFAEDLRPGFIGHIVMTFHWDPPNDRQLQKAIIMISCLLSVCLLCSTAAGILEGFELSVYPLPSPNFGDDSCGSPMTFTDGVSKVREHYI